MTNAVAAGGRAGAVAAAAIATGLATGGKTLDHDNRGSAMRSVSRVAAIEAQETARRGSLPARLSRCLGRYPAGGNQAQQSTAHAYFRHLRS